MPFQSVPTSGARSWQYFSINNQSYLVVANDYTTAPITTSTLKFLNSMALHLLPFSPLRRVAHMIGSTSASTIEAILLWPTLEAKRAATPAHRFSGSTALRLWPSSPLRRVVHMIGNTSASTIRAILLWQIFMTALALASILTLRFSSSMALRLCSSSRFRQVGPIIGNTSASTIRTILLWRTLATARPTTPTHRYFLFQSVGDMYTLIFFCFALFLWVVFAQAH